MNKNTDAASSTEIHQKIDHLVNDILMPATMEIFTPCELGELFAEFIAGYKLTGKDLTKDQSEALYTKAFIPWLLFNWRTYKTNDTLAKLHMKNKNLMRSINAEQKRWINEICHTHYSFYQMINKPDHDNSNIILEDILMNKEIVVEFDQYAYHLLTGKNKSDCKNESNAEKDSVGSAGGNYSQTDIIFAKIVKLSGKNIIVGIMPIAIAGNKISELIKLQEMIKSKIDNVGNAGSCKSRNCNHDAGSNNFFTSDILCDHEPLLRKCYFPLAFSKAIS